MTIVIVALHNEIIGAIAVADHSLPRKQNCLAKPFWSPELTALKQKSLDAHNLWKSCNGPRSGPLYREKLQTYYEYKTQLRKSKAEMNCNMSTQISDNLLSKDGNGFWKSWNQVNVNPWKH